MTGGFLYFWRSYTSEVSGSSTRRIRCVGCSRVFEYDITRVAVGGGHSPFLLDTRRAKEDARTRAHANLVQALQEAIEPVHCPVCGIFQPEMLRVLGERYGKRYGKLYDPNKYALEQLAISPEEACRVACTTNTVEAYVKFKEVWPALSLYADEQIKEIKYPPRLRKLIAIFGWFLWGLLFWLIVGVVFGVFRPQNWF